MKNISIPLRVLGVLLGIILLVLIRNFQSSLFYDPFLEYFANDAADKVLPNYDAFTLYANVMLRYAINATISIVIIALVFWNKSITISAIKVYTVLGIVVMMVYIVMIENHFPMGEKVLFFMRRLLIQPLVLLILLPAYYFIQQRAK